MKTAAATKKATAFELATLDIGHQQPVIVHQDKRGNLFRRDGETGPVRKITDADFLRLWAKTYTNPDHGGTFTNTEAHKFLSRVARKLKGGPR